MSDLVWTPVKIRLGQIIAWQDNPRMSTKAQAQRLIKSERELGQIQTLAVSPFTDDSRVHLYDGHQRVSAWMTIKDPSYEVTALQSNRMLTDDERKKVSVLLHTATGSWSWDALSSWSAADLREWGMDKETLSGWSNDVTNLKELLNSENAEKVDAEPQIDRAAELAEKWQTSTGQLWRLGEHRLLIGDCTVRENVERLMGGERAQLNFSDPPYGYEYQSNMRTKSKKFEVLENDDKFIDFIPNMKLFSDGWALVCTSWKVVREWIEICSGLGTLDNMIIWDKGGGGMGDLSHSLLTDYEIILAYGRGETIKGKRIGSVWGVNKDAAADYEHATQKPVGLLTMAVETFSLSGDIVADWFCGSGTTIIAAHNLNRRCYAMEISPNYGAVILQRWFDATGIQPELVENGTP